MSTLPRYCSYCGAANEADSHHCFACKHALNTQEEREQEILLNGRYRLLTRVGAGGFGGVYRAIDTAEESRVVAVKQINLRGLSAREAIEATDGFNRESRMLSALRHPNLAVIRDTFTDPEHWYLVMDFIEGETLEEYIRRKGNPGLPLSETLAISIQLCTVLHYLHTREPAIIFRDLKPGNVMHTAGRKVYLIDFGIARHFSPGKSKDTIPFGSPGYAAPEQYGRAQTDARADIYSLGALLHHLLTGNDPAESPFRFAPLPMADSTELAELDALIQRMVATEPGERPSSMAEVKATLQRLAEGVRQKYEWTRFDVSSPLQPPIQAPTSPGRTTRRTILTTALTLGGVTVGLGGLIWCGAYLIHPRFAGTGPFYPPSPGVAKSQFTYSRHTGPITALSWSPDGTMVASGSADKTVQVWRATDGAWLYTYYGYESPVTSIVWATDRVNEIASAGQKDGTVQIWDALKDHTYLNWKGDGRVLALAWQANSPWIASGGTDREIYTWNAETGARGASYRGHKGDVRAILWLPGTWQSATPGITTTKAAVSGGADGTVQIWDAANGKHISTYTGHTAGVNGLALLTHAPIQPVAYIVSASDDGTVQVWRQETTFQPSAGDSLYIHRGHQGKVNAVARLNGLPPYYSLPVASAGDDHTVQVWGMRGEHILTYRQHQAPVKALAASPVDRRVASGDEDGQVHVWTIAGLTR